MSKNKSARALRRAVAEQQKNEHDVDQITREIRGKMVNRELAKLTPEQRQAMVNNVFKPGIFV